MDEAELEAQAILEEMYDGLMRPVVEALRKRSINLSSQKLIIIPFGETANFPFHAMFEAKEKDGKYLFERFKGIAYTPSLDIYLRGRKNRIAGCDGILGLAPTQFENGGSLSYTIREVEEIGKFFQRPRLLLNREATKEQLLKEYIAYPALHFATHAEFNQQHPLDSKIRLYGDSDDRNNLSAADLTDLNLQLTGKLVVLSACETGVQRPEPGDDYVGIERYLLAARASAVVSSLWPVNDEAAMEFMKEFYREFTNGCIDPSFAWRTAMVRAKDKRRKNIFTWAPFKVTGY
jgi:CHAT domain-containing protein